MGTKSTIGFNYPLYLHPSDTPGTLLVFYQLLRIENYNVWSQTMKITLLAKNKLGFVDGTCFKDSLLEDMGYQWERCNAIVLSWILNTVSKELSAGIAFTSSTVVVWNDLGEWFHKVDGLRIYFLHREIASHLQVCSQILLMNPLPSVNHAYSMLMQEESQRQHSSSVVGIDLVSFYSAHMFTKKKANNGSGSVINNASVIDTASGNKMTGDISFRPQALVFTQEQSHQILSLLNKEPTVEATASLVGMVHVGHNWIIDTRAIDHILSVFNS
ncbi:hypothetical protein J1N35_002106 [Gossypium stocksii]|uniref:Retrotransposon Copia-like N-terminal domain-containing protein n=1 Tax=Gossypium stocksii TaxID=47602 RepID=A0A9D4AN10_9ROSI|nr:hypothetical protein J1N35_002106 [Gossypium stocksii]